MKERPLQHVIAELGIKAFKSYEPEAVKAVCQEVFADWRTMLEEAPATSVLLWIGDGDEVFNWRGEMDDEINYNRSVGFNNLNYPAYPPSRHYRTHPAIPYMDTPPTLTYRALQAIIVELRATARKMLGRKIAVGTVVDAGPEFVQSPFKFERHPEIIEGGPNSRMPKTMAFLNCYAQMKADTYPYAEFPFGLPEGTPFGEFLGRQLRSMCKAVGIDYCWFSNGFGITHYAWSYVGEVFDGETWEEKASPEIIARFDSFWKTFRKHCPRLPIHLRGTNYTVGQDAATHGVDIRRVYKTGKLELPAPNPPWGSSHLELEMAAHLSRISWTPTERILFRYYINDSWFASRPWFDYYNREPFDIYCPLSAGRVNADGTVSVPTDLSLMTVNSGFGDLYRVQGIEVTPHLKRAMDYSPDAAGPVVWVYPFDEYCDYAKKGDTALRQVFFQDWFVTRCIAGGAPINTVVNTGAFCELLARDPAALAGSVLFAPVPGRKAGYLDTLLDFVARGGKAVVYGALAEAPARLREALGVQLAEGLDGLLEVESDLVEDEFEQAPPARQLHHRAASSGGPICEVATPDDATCVPVRVVKEGVTRAYAVVRRDPAWQGGTLVWIRGSLPFEVNNRSVEPIFDDPGESHDAGTWLRPLLEEVGISIRQHRASVATKPAFLFIHRNDGAFIFSGHKPDVTATVSLRLPFGAPLFEEREAFLHDGHAHYHLDKSFHYHCRVFVEQAAEGPIRYKELRIYRGEEKNLQVDGLRDARVTIFPSREALRRGAVKIRSVNVYAIPDPTSEDELAKRSKTAPTPEVDLPYTVDEAAGAVVVEGVTGAITVGY